MKSICILLIGIGLSTGARAAGPEPAAPAGTNAYPLATCVVSRHALGDMGDPYVFRYEGRVVKLCCESCLKKFTKDPATYMVRLDEAEKARAAAGRK